MKILGLMAVVIGIILVIVAIYHFIPKSVEGGNKDGLYIKITRPYGWGNDIEIKSINVYYEQKPQNSNFDIKIEKDKP